MFFIPPQSNSNRNVCKHLKTMNRNKNATRNKCIASSNKCLASSNKNATRTMNRFQNLEKMLVCPGLVLPVTLCSGVLGVSFNSFLKKGNQPTNQPSRSASCFTLLHPDIRLVT